MIADLGPYEAVRDSGVAWLGEVPGHWQVRRVKSLFREKEGRSGDGTGVLLSLTRTRGIVPQADASSRLAGSDDLSNYKVCSRGDLVMNRMQAWSGMFAVSPLDGLISPDYSLFEATGASDVMYFAYLFKTPLLVGEFARRSKGIGSGFNRLYTPDFGSVFVAVPPAREQDTIVHFLDHVDQRIRRYIGAKQKLIKLLEEQMQAIIHRAVTRGLDHNVRLKTSGVDWLGDVPNHWDVSRLKTRLSRNDAGAWGSDFSDTGTIVLRSTEQSADGTWRIDVPARRALSPREAATTLLREGDLVITKSSGSAAHIGKTSLVTADIASLRCGFSNFMQRLQCSAAASPRFVQLFLNNRAGRDQLVHLSSTTTGLGNLSGTILGNLWLAFPPLAEQERICDGVAMRVEPFVRALAAAKGHVALVKEYRTRLVAEVVTGKLDVREAAAWLPEEADEPEPLDDADAAADAENEEGGDFHAVAEETGP